MMNYYTDNLLEFIYGGVASSTYFLYLTNIEGLYDSFERDIEFIEVQGRDGDLAIDNKRKKSKDITLEGFIDLDRISNSVEFSKVANDIEQWLQGEVKYKPLQIKGESKIYNAICINQIKISEVIEGLGEVMITFKIQP